MAITIEVVVKVDGATKSDRTYTVTAGGDQSWVVDGGIADSGSHTIYGYVLTPVVSAGNNAVVTGDGGVMKVKDKDAAKFVRQLINRH